WTISCPIQSLAISVDTGYTASIWFKIPTANIVPDDVEIDVRISARLGSVEEGVIIELSSQDTTTLRDGWTMVTTKVSILAPQYHHNDQIVISLGLVVSILSPRAKCYFDLLVGQVVVYPTVLPTQCKITPAVLFAEQIESKNDSTKLV